MYVRKPFTEMAGATAVAPTRVVLPAAPRKGAAVPGTVQPIARRLANAVAPMPAVRVGDMTIAPAPTLAPAPDTSSTFTPAELPSDGGGDGGTYDLSPGGGESAAGGGGAEIDVPKAEEPAKSRAWLWWILAIAGGSLVVYFAARQPKGALQGLQSDRLRGAKLIVPDLRTGKMYAWFGGDLAFAIDKQGNEVGRWTSPTTMEEARLALRRRAKQGA